MGLKDLLAKKTLPFRRGIEFCSLRVEYQAVLLQKPLNGYFPLPQLLLAVGEQNTIIHISDVAFAVEHLLDVVIEKTEVVVGKPLAGEVPNRQTPSSFVRGKEGIAGEIVEVFNLRIAVVDDGIDQPEGIGTGNFTPDQ